MSMPILIKDVKVILTAPAGINLAVVKVETTEPGLYGLGCATFAYRHLAVKTLVEEYLKPLVVGHDAANIEQLWHLMNNNAYWRNGPIENNAISGIDMALWDLKGKVVEFREQGEWFRQLRAKTVTPLAQGELFNNPHEWRYLITERLLDFIRVHISQIGGITPTRKLQIFAEQFGVRTAWHGPGDMSPVAHAANVHLDLAAHNFGVQEWSGTEPPNHVIQGLKGPREALLDVFPGLPTYKDVYANAKPGFGVDLNEKEAAKYPCENAVTTWTQTRLRDGTPQTP